MYNRLDSIPACDRQTDRQTAILPRHSSRYAYASRGKNVDRVTTLFLCYFSRDLVIISGLAAILIFFVFRITGSNSA